ncbi:hypothetical protein [Noviherbaspirillum galbum]|uniref:Uncharacterized protein n=1 Tax=Noviherbaspirillum galbum TaxID=2709383 RepID=A0A6B3SFX7_9BURK|nr:hypothetical protein [Noviherbaspirillum galbum]NEX59493.1 hypothetical protein [Noviherbaspirillum galbum]
METEISVEELQELHEARELQLPLRSEHDVEHLIDLLTLASATLRLKKYHKLPDREEMLRTAAHALAVLMLESPRHCLMAPAVH